MYDIWLPREYGAREADKAAKEYDPRLGFGFNQDTHQWCIFFEQGTTEESREHKLPILGFNGIPHPDDVKKRLYESDSLRRGEEILAAINRDNEKVKQVFEDAASEGSEAAAEGFEYLMRQAGQAPYHKSFRKIVKE